VFGKMRRWRIPVVLAAAGLALAGCIPVGYDGGMYAGCFVDYNHKTIVDGTNCSSSDPNALINSGKSWVLSQGPIALDRCNYAVRTDRTGTLNFNVYRNSPTPFGNKLVTDMGIYKDACQDNTEIAYDINNGQSVGINGLHSFMGFGDYQYGHTGHVAVQAYMSPSSDGQKHTVSIVLPPFEENQPSSGGNWASGCVKWHGSPLPGHHFVILDGGCFGYSLCVWYKPGCPQFTHIDIDWNRILDYVKSKGYNGWDGLWNELSSTTASIHVELDTFTPKGGPGPNWVAVDQDVWASYYCDGGTVC
jgi:hypothetical protein